MKKLSFLFLLGLSGCVSISTYEQALKRCSQESANASELNTLSSKNAQLESQLKEKTAEQERLASEMKNVRGTYDELVQELKESIARGEVGVKETSKGLTITVGNQILFASGKAALEPRGMKVLNQVAGVIKKSHGHLIQVEGHTDNVPISGTLKTRFPSNWELSAARAASVVRFLEQEGKIDSKFLVLTAFAETHPMGDNATVSGRQMNRRVEITLIADTEGVSK